MGVRALGGFQSEGVINSKRVAFDAIKTKNSEHIISEGRLKTHRHTNNNWNRIHLPPSFVCLLNWALEMTPICSYDWLFSKIMRLSQLTHYFMLVRYCSSHLYICLALWERIDQNNMVNEMFVWKIPKCIHSKWVFMVILDYNCQYQQRPTRRNKND